MFSKLIKIFFRYSALSLLLFIIITISTKLKVAAIDDSGSVRINLDIDGGSYGHELLWHKPYSGSSDSFAGPIIEGAVGYIGNPTNGNFRCFNISDGSLVWETYIGKSDSTPILDNQGSYIYICIGLQFGSQ